MPGVGLGQLARGLAGANQLQQPRLALHWSCPQSGIKSCQRSVLTLRSPRSPKVGLRHYSHFNPGKSLTRDLAQHASRPAVGA
jgi:hypothetical protein